MSKPSRKIIVTCAVTGAIHTPTMSDALPYRPEDIARQAIDAAQAGAAVLHLHARNPENGSVSIDSEHFLGFLPSIKASTNAVVNLYRRQPSQYRGGAHRARKAFFARDVLVEHG